MRQSQSRLRSLLIGAAILGLIFLAACTQSLVRQPDVFTFGDALTGVELNTDFTSPEATLAGFDGQLTATITAPGTLILNGTPVAGTTADVQAGDKIAVRLTSSNSYETTVSSKVTIATRDATYSVTTRAASTTPDAFTFGDPRTGVELNTDFTSPVATLAGFDGQLTATITAPGTLILNGTPVAGTTADVQAGDKIAVRLTSSNSYETTVSSKVTIATREATYSVTTRPRPAAPTITEFNADTLSPDPGAGVTLSWTVTGDVESIRLTSDRGDDVSIPVGTTTWGVTAPENAPSVTYTLTLKNNETNDEDSGDLLVQVPLWVCVDETYSLTFPDTEFEIALRLSPQIPDTGPITCADMQSVVQLSTPTGDGSGQITDLTGLQHAINLEELHYDGHEIVSLAPVAGLTKLTFLSVERNRHLLDLSPLQNLHALIELGLWDVGPILTSGSTGEEAALDGLDNAQLDKIAGLTNIEVLYLSSNNLDNLGFVGNMSKLRILFAMNNDITDFAPLADKPDLRTALLGYQRTPVTQNVSAFDTSPLLARLGLEYGRVGNTDFLASHTEMWEIRLQGNRLPDAAIAGLRGNGAFPVATAPLESAAGPTIPGSPTLKLEDNCLDTTASSATETWITGLQAGTPAVTVEGYPAGQSTTLCSVPPTSTARQAKMLQELEEMRIAGEIH